MTIPFLSWWLMLIHVNKTKKIAEISKRSTNKNFMRSHFCSQKETTYFHSKAFKYRWMWTKTESERTMMNINKEWITNEYKITKKKRETGFSVQNFFLCFACCFVLCLYLYTTTNGHFVRSKMNVTTQYKNPFALRNRPKIQISRSIFLLFFCFTK